MKRLLVAMTLAGATLVPGFARPAAASVYSVKSCQASSSRNASAWVSTVRANDSVDLASVCGAGQGQQTQFYDFRESFSAQASIGGTTIQAAAGDIAALRFAAPGSARITSITYRRLLDAANDEFTPGLFADSAPVEVCIQTFEEPDCSAFSTADGVRTFAFAPGVGQLDLALRCTSAPCDYGFGTVPAAVIAIYSSEVTIEENTPPSVGAIATTGVTDGWANESATLGFSGSDALGIRRFEVLDGDQLATTLPRTCVDWSVRPCSEPTAGLTTSASVTKSLNDLGLGFGPHTLRVRAIDAAGNATSSAPVAINIDDTTWDPLFLSGGGTSSAQQRQMTWIPSGSGAPLASASARLCIGTGDQPGNCRDVPVDPRGPLSFELPSDGSSATALVTLTDAAGNASTSETLTYKRDAAAPAAPTLALTTATGNDRLVTVGGETGATVTAKLCTVGGACTDVPKRPAPGQLTVTLPAAGNYDLTATLTDPYGNTSEPTTLRLTRAAVTTEPKSMKLEVSVRSNLRKRRITVTGSVAAGSTDRIDVQLIGKSRGGRRITSKAKITVPASGKFTKRLSFPARGSVRRPVQLVLTPRPNDGFRTTRLTNTIRP